MEAKKDIRKRVLELRNAMTEMEWEEKSYQIYKNLTSHPFFLESKEIYVYIDFRKEVGTREIIESAWRDGKRVAVPKIEGKKMNFYYIQSWKDVEKGHWGIKEPQTNMLAEADEPCMIMPGSVFDLNRNRIGYGGGFYDTYLESHSKCRTIALAFEFQVLKEIPTEEYDIKPQCIITEEKIYV